MRYILFFVCCLLLTNSYAQPSSPGHVSKKLVADANTVYKDENNKEISKNEFDQKFQSGLYQKTIDQDGNRITAFRLEPSKTAKGLVAPQFQARTLDGQVIDLAALKGKVVVLNFWFTKCMPCIKEIPELNGLVEKYTANDVVFLAITHDNQEMVQAFLKNTPFRYSHSTDGRSIENLYSVRSFPTNLVIGKDGKFVFSQNGYSPQTRLLIEAGIEEALKATPPSK